MPSTGEYPLRLVDFPVEEPAHEPEQLRPLVEQLLKELRFHRQRTARVVVKTGGKVLFLRAEQIEWVEAAGITSGCTWAVSRISSARA